MGRISTPARIPAGGPNLKLSHIPTSPATLRLPGRQTALSFCSQGVYKLQNFSLRVRRKCSKLKLIYVTRSFFLVHSIYQSLLVSCTNFFFLPVLHSSIIFRSECSPRTRFVGGSVCLSICMSVCM